MPCDARSCHCRVRDGGSAIGMARSERMNRVGPVFFALAFLLAACSEDDKQFLLTYDHPKPIQVASAPPAAPAASPGVASVAPADGPQSPGVAPAPPEMATIPVAPVTVASEPALAQANAPIVEAAP